jgi:hypothetical protein
LQELWDLPQKGAAWAAAGYQGAISSGKTTCGLLIGCGMAIGLKLGVDNEGNPQEHEDERGKAIGGVYELYQSFLKEYGETTCKDLIGCDLSVPEEREKYRNEGIWKEVCDVCLNFVMNKCHNMAEQGKI